MNARFRAAANASVGTSAPISSSDNRGKSAGFTPTVTSLMILVVIEYGAYVWLRHFFRHAHGG